MTDAAGSTAGQDLPQIMVLVAAGAAFAAAAAELFRRRRRGVPLVAARPHAAVCWDGRDVMLLVAVYMVGVSAIAPAAGAAPAPVARLAGDALLSLGTLWAAVAWLRVRGADPAMLGIVPHRGDLALAVRGVSLLVLPLLALAAVLNALVRYEHPVIDALGGDRNAVTAAVVALSAVVMAPVTEEFFFRRVLQGWLEKRYAGEPALAVTLSAACFSVAHVGHGLAFVPLFAMACLLGLIAERTGSIVPCVLIHAMFNAVSVCLLLAQPLVARGSG